MSTAVIVAAGVFAFFTIIVVILVGGNALLWRLKRPKPPSEDSIRRRQERLLRPKWDEIEKCFGQSIPSSIKELYKQIELISQTNIVFRDRSGHEWEISQFEPADLETLQSAWPELQRSKNFPFASDLVGDVYYIPLDGSGSQNCPVMCYHHDGNEIEHVSNSLTEFFSWRQRP